MSLFSMATTGANIFYYWYVTHSLPHIILKIATAFCLMKSLFWGGPWKISVRVWEIVSNLHDQYEIIINICQAIYSYGGHWRQGNPNNNRNVNGSERNHSYSRLGEGDLHFTTWEYLVMKVGYSLKTVFHWIKFDQSHVLLVWVAQDLHCFYSSILTKDLVKSVFSADIFFERAYMKSLGGRIDC